MWLARLLVAAVSVAVVAGTDKTLVEQEVAALNLGVACMLLGSIGFMMGVFYMVNHYDQDMVVYTWKVICATISIFVSVLMFQAVHGVFQSAFLVGASRSTRTIAAFAHSFGWFLVLQVFLAVVSGAVSFPGASGPLDQQEPEERKRAADKLFLDLKCWGIILGHITGFAAINAWCHLQQYASGSVFQAFLAVPVSGCMIWLFYMLTDVVREKIALADDGVKDEFEQAWDEATEETEDDVMGLTLSYILVQAIRYAVIGVLPDSEGNLPATVRVSNIQILILMGIGVSIAALSFSRTILVKRSFGRISTWSRLVCDFTFSWSIMYALESFFAMHGLGGEAAGCLGQVILAFLVTILSFFIIFLLDKEADKFENMAGVRNKRTQDAIRSVVAALGVLIGFSWEKCFEAAVDDTAQKAAVVFPPCVLKLVMALVLAIIVVPAWRWYILPVLKDLDAFDEAEEETDDADSVSVTNCDGGCVYHRLSTSSDVTLAPSESARAVDAKARGIIRFLSSQLESKQARIDFLERTLAQTSASPCVSMAPTLLPHHVHTTGLKPLGSSD